MSSTNHCNLVIDLSNVRRTSGLEGTLVCRFVGLTRKSFSIQRCIQGFLGGCRRLRGRGTVSRGFDKLNEIKKILDKNADESLSFFLKLVYVYGQKIPWIKLYIQKVKHSEIYSHFERLWIKYPRLFYQTYHKRKYSIYCRLQDILFNF